MFNNAAVQYIRTLVRGYPGLGMYPEMEGVEIINAISNSLAHVHQETA